MLNITNELKAKLLAAQSAEEAAALVKSNGQEITSEDAAHLWEEISRHRNQDGSELSTDELEAISGGRNAMTEGCAATVEAGSNCYFTDNCLGAFFVIYEVYPYNASCPDDGQNPMYWDYTKKCFCCPEMRHHVGH